MKGTLVSICVLLSLFSSTAVAGTWRIEPGGSGDAPTIQAGIDSAAVGDIVLLANGTYTGEGNHDIDFGGKSIVVVSESGDPGLCVIDVDMSGICDPRRGFYFHSGEDRQAVLEGVTVTSGFVACNYGGDGYGGGVLCSGASPTISNCNFSWNGANAGGGMFIGGGAPVIEYCTFSNNRVYYPDPNPPIFGFGGGLLCAGTSATIRHCVFSNNIAVVGGGVLVDGGSPTFSWCLLNGNSDALWCFAGSSPTLQNCTICCNGGGIGLELSDPVIDRTLIAYNQGSAVWCSAGNPGNPILTCCAIYGNGSNWTGCIADQCGANGNFYACPSMCGVHNQDFHLCDESPCLPGNHPDGYDCGLIGVFGEGCGCGPTHTEPTSWGAIKAMYR